MGTELDYMPPDRRRNGKTIHIYGMYAIAFGMDMLLLVFVEPLRWLAILVLIAGGSWFLISLKVKALPIEQARHNQSVKWEDLRLRERVIAIGEQPGYSTRFEAGGTVVVTAPRKQSRVVDSSAEPTAPAEPKDAPMDIPERVSYDSIRYQIPQDHVLIGVGEGGMIDAREKEIKGLIWIPGSSGAGKSNTTALRVEEDYERGHRLLGIDPHFFKDDSLSNLVRSYMDRFIEPIAHTSEDIERMLDLFITEAEKRKSGGKCWPLTLLYDEIGSQVSDKPEDEIEKRIIEKTKKVIRLAGQETRGFNMNVIAISQDAAGLAFLRKRALLVLGHKTVMMSERELVCNGRTDLARQMDNWPIGRTVVYGVAVQGILVRQQPLMTPRLASSRETDEIEIRDFRKIPEGNGEDAGREKDTGEEINPLVLRKFLSEAGKMRARGDSIDSILKAHGMTPGGRNNQNLKALLEQEGA